MLLIRCTTTTRRSWCFSCCCCPRCRRRGLDNLETWLPPASLQKEPLPFSIGSNPLLLDLDKGLQRRDVEPLPEPDNHRPLQPLHIALQLPGMHNVRNALAAVAIADELQVGDAAVVAALERFEGIDRRFQSLGEVETKAGRVMLVDDYGHHPTEIAATLAAARAGWPDRRVVLVFQPHRFSRTFDLMDDFASVLSEADVVLLLDVYAAGEAPIAGADGRAMARAVRTRGAVEPVFVESLEDVPAVLEGLLQDGDLVLTMGAGDIGTFAAGLPERLARKPNLKVHS